MSEESQLEIQARYYQERLDDLQDTVMDLVRIMADLVSELRTEIDLARAARLKADAEAGIVSLE
jgi:hypothetical protein